MRKDYKLMIFKHYRLGFLLLSFIEACVVSNFSWRISIKC
jgi:hypothetical protein